MEQGSSTWGELQEGDLEQARTMALHAFLALDTRSEDSPEELVEYVHGQLRELLRTLRFEGVDVVLEPAQAEDGPGQAEALEETAERHDETGRLAKNLLDKWSG